MTREQATTILTKHDQLQVMDRFDELDDEQKEQLLSQIDDIDWAIIDADHDEKPAGRGVIEPLGAVEIPEIEERREEFTEEGIKEIRAGKVGAVLLAGGMGTRLGHSGPKGVYDMGVTKKLYIFECLIRNLMEVTDVAGVYIPLYIMTSEKNHSDTVKFFEDENYFGYPPEMVHFFIQEMAAAVDFSGKLLLEAPGRLATSPNGNGGWFMSLHGSGLLDDIHDRGIEWLNVFAVDNVLQRICDPAFIGATVINGAESGSKVVKKVSPDEGVGVLCLEDGKPSIVEYYEMTEEMRTEYDESGELKYRFGVILNYLFRVDALERHIHDELSLHVVKKKIPYIDGDWNSISPSEPNGYKFETLILDMVHLMESNLPYEVVREHEFAPVKNLHGVDSVDSARELLEKNGVTL